MFRARVVVAKSQSSVSNPQNSLNNAHTSRSHSIAPSRALYPPFAFDLERRRQPRHRVSIIQPLRRVRASSVRFTTPRRRARAPIRRTLRFSGYRHPSFLASPFERVIDVRTHQPWLRYLSMWIMYYPGCEGRRREARREARRSRTRSRPGNIQSPVRYKPTSQPDSYCGIQSSDLIYPNGCVNSTLGNSHE